MMDHYTVLVVSSAIIAGLALLIFAKTRNIAFPLGLTLIYYMSLYGAWAVIKDKSGGDSGSHYAYLEHKMFEVHLDPHYLLALLLYAGFIIVIEVALLLFARPAAGASVRARPPIEITHGVVLVVALLACAGSYTVVRNGILEAHALGVSAYDYMRRGFGETPPLFTLHQILNRVALLPAVIGFVASISGDAPRLIRGAPLRYAPLLYLAPIGFMVWLSFVLGYKSELFLSGVMGGLFYLANAERPRWLLLAFAGLLMVAGMALVDLTRFTPLSNVDQTLEVVGPDLAGDVFEFVRTSNEAFAAHFSMYGALSKDIPLTWGSSLVALAASAVPHVLWPERPPDIYSYYAENIDAVAGQGYTIHHATGWYLNFGIPGVLIGAAVLAWVWLLCYNGYMDLGAAGDFSFGQQARRVFYAIAPWSFVGYIPFICRAGPEIYKGLVVEGLLIPVAIILLASIWPAWRGSLLPRET